MVIRNHRKLYRDNADPWNVGDADSERYNRYVQILRQNCGGDVLDMGCGTGAFLNRLDFFTERYGFDISGEAMNRAASKYPSCRWAIASITNPPTYRYFNTIICSDVIYYVWRKRKVMRWIAEHLKRDGTAFIAAYAVGGRYPTPESLNKLVSRYMDVYYQETFDSGHTVILARKKIVFGAFTVDYENWMPVAGDFFKEVWGPAEYLDKLGIPITFFVDMAGLDKRAVPQLKYLAKKGHDLQLHYHFGFPDPYVSAEKFSGNVAAVLRKAKKRLEKMSGCPVVVFRAGAYQVQPFLRLSFALNLIGIHADSSVWEGGVSEERGYDFRGAPKHPYWPMVTDAAKPSHVYGGMTEIPISTRRGKRWSEGNFYQPKDRYNVLISHTKGGHDWRRVTMRVNTLDVEWITMSEMVSRVKADMARNLQRLNYAGVMMYSLPETKALCHEQCVNFAKILSGMGFKPRQVSLRAKGMPNGRGKDKIDTHEVLSVECNGLEYILDPTSRMFYVRSLDDLLRLKCGKADAMYAGSLFFAKITHYRYIPRIKGLRWLTRWKRNPHAK